MADGDFSASGARGASAVQIGVTLTSFVSIAFTDSKPLKSIATTGRALQSIELHDSELERFRQMPSSSLGRIVGISDTCRLEVASLGRGNPLVRDAGISDKWNFRVTSCGVHPAP
jgi:hypothetical protein